MKLLKLTDVAKSYGGKPALQGINLDLGHGEVIGLLGPNDAGKSTLFQIAAGLFAPDSGTVNLFGTSYAKSSSAILARRGVVFQNLSLDADITGQANLKFFGGQFGVFGGRLRPAAGTPGSAAG